jgi:hypothetical protein
MGPSTTTKLKIHEGCPVLSGKESPQDQRKGYAGDPGVKDFRRQNGVHFELGKI